MTSFINLLGGKSKHAFSLYFPPKLMCQIKSSVLPNILPACMCSSSLVTLMPRFSIQYASSQCIMQFGNAWPCEELIRLDYCSVIRSQGCLVILCSIKCFARFFHALNKGFPNEFHPGAMVILVYIHEHQFLFWDYSFLLPLNLGQRGGRGGDGRS